MFLLARWFYLFVVTLAGFAAVDLYASIGEWRSPLVNVLILLFSLVYFSLVERAATGFRGVKPRRTARSTTREFWRGGTVLQAHREGGRAPALRRHPVPVPAPRLVGVRLGKRLFDDGGSMAEKNIVTIGDDVTLNAGTVLQCHSQEDYAFKSDRITVGSGCTVGVAASSTTA